MMRHESKTARAHERAGAKKMPHKEHVRAGKAAHHGGQHKGGHKVVHVHHHHHMHHDGK